VREVLLDSMDGGAAQNIFLEGGPKFSDPGLDRGGDLHPVDQAVILALCLDVSNSNPADGLTTEVMMPYLLRVLEQAKNWMIHSTGLLERSWLEYHLQRTADRAMLQIQALLDQHTTKLTIMQSTYKSITEDSAPAQDRLAYLHCIVYPAQYELKKDLAQRYLQSSVVVSALGLFRELELWDEVVTCYQLMEKPHRAEMVVRERLRASGETPYMLTALADLTSDERLYEKAWELSRHRYGRAKRTLAKICYNRGDNRACVSHLVEALAIHPLQPNMWYLKGLACMRYEAYDDALQAFTRCVQQDMEIGEAWANSGAIFMKRCQHAKAYVSLTEALRHKRDSWQVIENLMICCLVLSRWREGVVHMNKLLDLRNKSDRPVHKDELRHLALVVSSKARLDFEELKAGGARCPGSAEEVEGEGEGEGEGRMVNLPTPAEIAQAEAQATQAAQAGEQNGGVEEIRDEDLPEVAKAVEKLLVRITNTLPSDADIWDILARFEAFLGRQRLVLECRVRQFRTMSNAPGWEKDRAKVAPVLQAAEKLVDAHHLRFNRRTEVVKREDLLACKSMLQQAQRKIDIVFEGMPESLRLQEIAKGLTEIV
jgi:tetratricopeptide (TPR) repeat protein